VSGISEVELIGNPALAVSATAGAQLIFETLGATNSTTTTLIAKAPADGTLMSFHVTMLPLPSQLK
jgi:hypothetical protein